MTPGNVGRFRNSPSLRYCILLFSTPGRINNTINRYNLLGRSFQVTETVLAALTQDGLPPELVESLRAINDRKYFSKREFLGDITRLDPAPASRSERKLILRHSRLGFLGLERLVPNRTVREWVEALIFALIIASIVRTFLFAPFKIPSGSMIPTISIGDHIFATMFSYGVPVPFTDIKLFSQEVRRGDIIIFPYPRDPSVDYIKRVIAREDETVAVRNGKVLINGNVLNESYAYFDESIMALYRRQGRNLPDFGPVKVPPGHLFVMGDNRLNSSDSRVWGFVSESAVKGKGQIVYWSHDPREGWMGGYHLSRIGTLLQ